MKKSYIIFLLAILFTYSCDLKEEYENEMSKVVDAAGEWYVVYNHELLGEDPFGEGELSMLTFNTSSDVSDSMWLSDEGELWGYKVKIPVNLNGMTFGSNDTIINVVEGKESKVVLRNGKIIKNASEEKPSGATADSIYFEVWFEYVETVFSAGPGFFEVGGYRRTGFTEDEPH